MGELGDALDEGMELLANGIPDHYPREVISYSCMKQLLLHPMQWKLRYIDGVKSPQTIQMIIGEAIHHGIETYYLGGDHTAASQARLRKQATDFPERKQQEAGIIVDRVVDAYTRTYERQDTSLVELRTTATLARGVRLEAVTDLLEDGVIVDHKTTSRGKGFVPDPLQLIFNAMTLHRNGYEVERGVIRQLRKDVTGKRENFPIPIDHEVDLSPTLVRRGVREVLRRLHDIDARVRMNLWNGPPSFEDDYTWADD